MINQFNATELRVLGVLLEKEVTTPDYYPMTLNSITAACNQKSNREPVMTLSESEVQEALDSLNQQRLLFEEQSARVTKYKHRFCNTEFSSLQFSAQQVAVLCVLFLRGPQTPGELRTRTQRLAQFTSVDELEACLQSLQHFNGEQLVQRLAREPGKRESRYIHLFADAEATLIKGETPEGSSNISIASNDQDLAQRVELLELEVEELKVQLSTLISKLPS